MHVVYGQFSNLFHVHAAATLQDTKNILMVHPMPKRKPCIVHTLMSFQIANFPIQASATASRSNSGIVLRVRYSMSALYAIYFHGL